MVRILALVVAISGLAGAEGNQAGKDYHIQSSGGLYEFSWYSIDGGGGIHSSGESYSLTGTIGQTESGIHCEGNQELTGGFESGSGAGDSQTPIIMADGFEACFFNEVYR